MYVVYLAKAILILRILIVNSAAIRDERESSRPLSSAQTESEDDTYGGQRGRTFAKKQRQKLQAMTSGSGTPQLSEVRFSTRRAAKVTNYNEDDNFDLSEEDTENMTPNYWTYAEEDTSPAIDVVLNHRLKEGTGTLQCWFLHLRGSGADNVPRLECSGQA